jgi:hypothetical protein
MFQLLCLPHYASAVLDNPSSLDCFKCTCKATRCNQRRSSVMSYRQQHKVPSLLMVSGYLATR